MPETIRSGWRAGATAAVPESAERFERLPVLQAGLRGCAGFGELFARAAGLARAECGFARALVVGVDGHVLTAETSDVISDAASDTLRRRILDTPVPLRAGTWESEVVEGQAGWAAATRPSTLVDQLDLGHVALGAVAPESTVLALVIAERAGAPVANWERTLISCLGVLLATAVERLVLSARLDELSGEIRHLAVSARALMNEARHAPIALPRQDGSRSSFPLLGGPEPARRAELRELLSEREVGIVTLLVQGRSNREIAEQLVLSPETVKGHVARILRKFNASNRAEAVARYLSMSPAN
jgi:DNA-binding CsgD family transcriptional regulator